MKEDKDTSCSVFPNNSKEAQLAGLSAVERLIICSTTERHKTDVGTDYEIEKWICPICIEEKSTLIIDDEVCHGDAKAATNRSGEHVEGCIDCIMSI